LKDVACDSRLQVAVLMIGNTCDNARFSALVSKGTKQWQVYVAMNSSGLLSNNSPDDSCSSSGTSSLVGAQ
jgi:hypothetical protein